LRGNSVLANLRRRRDEFDLGVTVVQLPGERTLGGANDPLQVAAQTPMVVLHVEALALPFFGELLDILEIADKRNRTLWRGLRPLHRVIALAMTCLVSALATDWHIAESPCMGNGPKPTQSGACLIRS